MKKKIFMMQCIVHDIPIYKMKLKPTSSNAIHKECFKIAQTNKRKHERVSVFTLMTLTSTPVSAGHYQSDRHAPALAGLCAHQAWVP